MPGRRTRSRRTRGSHRPARKATRTLTRRVRERVEESLPEGANGVVEMSPLIGFIGYAVRRAQMRIFAEFVETLREVDLRPGQFGVLTVISHNPGMRQSAVCAALGIQKANFVPLISALESRGLVVRHAGLNDRRSYALHLTPKGEAVLRRAGELQAQHEARMSDRIGNEGRERLLDLLSRVSG